MRPVIRSRGCDPQQFPNVRAYLRTDHYNRRSGHNAAGHSPAFPVAVAGCTAVQNLPPKCHFGFRGQVVNVWG